MKIDPGFYKVRDNDAYLDSYHLVRVYIENRKKYIQFDGSTPLLASDHEQAVLDQYTIVRRYTIQRPIGVTKAKMHITWVDDEGAEFAHSFTNVHVFMDYLNHFKRVAKKLGFSRQLVEYLWKLINRPKRA